MLEAGGLEPEIERSARAAPLTAAEATALLRSVDRVLVCRGRKTVEMAGRSAKPRVLKGPTGNFRAPLLQIDEVLLVGFNQQALADLLA